MTTEIREETHVQEIEEKKHDVEKETKVTKVNENRFDKLVDVMEVF